MQFREFRATWSGLVWTLAACLAVESTAVAVPCNPHAEWTPVSGTVQVDSGTGYEPESPDVDWVPVLEFDDCG